ncbi:hypothetical protein [Halovivax sp.]|uniref:hypothetical protein n=1 Tax=Halovivax sp. TaxID=1935978 RepID=UPI0025C401B6|nr:hypothetical protein [Halovivax sp.]
MEENTDEGRADIGEGNAGRISTDRETIRGWADDHQAVPVRRTGADESERFHVVGESEMGESHERVEWDDFFDRLDEGDHVVVYHGGEATEPFEVTRRDEVLSRSALDQEELEERLIEGETVTSEVRETTVVESVIVEEATVESELVGSEVVDQRVLDVELIERECTGCRLVAEGDHDRRELFDETRYFESVGGESGRGTVESGRSDADAAAAETGTDATVGEIEFTDDQPYYAELDVEEAWSVTREFLERFTVESRVAGTEVAETDTVEDRDIDVEGLHRSIAQSELLDVDLTSDEVLTECEIQTEFAEDDRIQTQFDRERVVEEEVVDRKRLRADVTGGELLGMETIHSQQLAAETGDRGTSGDVEGETVGTDTGGGAGRATLTDDEIGKTVVDATGTEIGMITDVDDRGEVMHVDAHPGIAERIKSVLGWGDADDDDYPVGADQIDRVDDDRVELKGTEELEGTDRSH